MRLAAAIAIVFTIYAGVPVHTKPLSKGEWERLSRPPLDSTQARDTRIWFSSLSAGSCRIKIEIEDTAGKTVRHITDEMIGKGYYNLYWDKKNDSGVFVPKGLYYYRVWSGCAPELKRKLWVSYLPFERVVRLTVDTADLEAAALISVDTPKVRLSLDVFRTDGFHIDTLCPDTVLTYGVHRVVWRPTQGASLGVYYLRMTVDQYIAEEKIRLR
jgi:hypothetical protein